MRVVVSEEAWGPWEWDKYEHNASSLVRHRSVPDGGFESDYLGPDYVNALEAAKAEAERQLVEEQEQLADYKGRNLAEYYHNEDLQQSLRELGVASIAAQTREQALRQALERLEWSGKIGCEGYQMGAPPLHLHTACPACRQLKPDANQRCFRKEAEGHKPDCWLVAALAATPTQAGEQQS